MIDDYMKKYREQMDKVTLSDSADQEILDSLLESNARKEVSYMKRTKRNISAAMVAAVITIASTVTVFAGVAIRGIIIKSNKAESQVEGLGAKVDFGDSYFYYDLLAGDEGEIYALTDNGYGGNLTGYHAVVWKSTDQGSTWETVLFQPDELNEESDVFAGDLREGESGIEALVLMEEKDDKSENGYVKHAYQITADSCVEYDIDEVYARLGDSLFNVKFVNDNIVAMVGAEECLLYDVNTQEIVKSLPYDLASVCLQTGDQFLIYGKEIYSCLNTVTLEEQKPEEGLQEFVQMMYKENGNTLAPPMVTWNDTIVCVTKMYIYEYRDGETTQVRKLTNAVNEADSFTGYLPICKVGDGEYYICALKDGNMSLWQIDGEKEEMK